MSIDPSIELLKRREESEDAARMLGRQQMELMAAMSAYKSAWRAARNQGWAASDLTKVGFIDPAKLPRLRTDKRGKENAETEAE